MAPAACLLRHRRNEIVAGNHLTQLWVPLVQHPDPPSTAAGVAYAGRHN